MLGKSYELSLVMANDALSRKLNHLYRGKKGGANVLSFPLSKISGEIYLNPEAVRREHTMYGMSERACMLYFFIHACLHLAGLTHGSTMERKEREILRRFLR